MGNTSQWIRATVRFEYPDIAGYPDGTGTLDQGTTAGRHEDAAVLAEFEGFMEGDSRDT